MYNSFKQQQASVQPRPKGKPVFKADIVNSKLYWLMQMTPGYPGNTVELMPGWSKGQGNESEGLPQLLLAKVANPLMQYFQRTDQIFVYETVSGLGRHLFPLVAVLQEDGYQLYGWADDPVVEKGLNAIYRAYYDGPQKQTPYRRLKEVPRHQRQTDLDHATRKFRGVQELKTFCRQMSERYGEDTMLTWYKKHAHFQPELFQSDVSEALTHAIYTAPNLDAAQTAMKSLHERHPSHRSAPTDNPPPTLDMNKVFGSVADLDDYIEEKRQQGASPKAIGIYRYKMKERIYNKS